MATFCRPTAPVEMNAMRQRARKFFGTILMLVLLVTYALVVMVFYDRFLTGQAPVFLILFFAVAGVAWAFPAGLLISWMLRPDPEKH